MGPNKFLEELGKVLAWADLSKSDWSVIEKYAKNGNSKKLLQFLGRTGITKQDYANAEKIISQMKENKVLKFNDFVNESKLNEGDMTKKTFLDLWKETYGENFISEYPAVAKILKNRPNNINKREISRIWDETYGEDFKEEYPGIWNKLD